jgi:CheY-like chemotaxis protein
MMPDMDGLELAGRIRGLSQGKQLPILLLSSASLTEDAKRQRELGIARSLIKPVKHSDLLEAIAQILKPVPEQKSAAPLGELAPVEKQRHVLLAEDGLINQKVAVNLLEQRGHTVVVASNGRQVLEKLEQELFDLVLMDVQMPEMDGFEATAAIRRKEQGTDLHLPIVAMTAHAMKGDRERCLEVGMDGYVPKPVRPHELYAAVEGAPPNPARIVPASFAGETPPPLEPVSTLADLGSGQLLNWNEALERVGGNAQMLKDLVALFLEEGPRLLAEIRRAMDQGNAAELRRQAHTLKGSAALFAAEPTVRAARLLEYLGRDGKLEEAERAWSEMEQEMGGLLAELERMEERLSKEKT